MRCSSARPGQSDDQLSGGRLQPLATAFFPRLCDAGGLCGRAPRNRRPAAQRRPAPPIACRSSGALGRINRRHSTRRWMKLRGQVKDPQPGEYLCWKIQWLRARGRDGFAAAAGQIPIERIFILLCNRAPATLEFT